MNNYAQLLRDPRWQKRRLEILQRDNFTCQRCFDSKSTLHVHHRYYRSGCAPWAYLDACLVTLCMDCHEYETARIKEIKARLMEALCDLGLLSDGLEEIQIACENVRAENTGNAFASVLAYWINEDRIAQLAEGYFSSLRKGNAHASA